MKNLIVRLIILGGMFLVIYYKSPKEFYDVIATLLLLVGLVLSYKEDRSNNLYNTISNYLFWLFTLYMVLSIKREYLFNIQSIFILLLLVKSITLCLNYFKFKKLEVPSTILSKVWIFTMFLYLGELILNSSHNFKYLFFYIGIISSIELILIVLKIKDWKPKINSIVNAYK